MPGSDTHANKWILGFERVAPRAGRQSLRGWPLRVLLSILVWTCAGWIFSLAELNSGRYGYSLRIYLTEFWIWGLIAPLVFALDGRLPFSTKQLGRRAGAHLAASLVFTVAYLNIFTVMSAILDIVPWSSLRASQLFAVSNLGWYLSSWLVCWVIIGAVLAYRYHERYISSELYLEKVEANYH